MNDAYNGHKGADGTFTDDKKPAQQGTSQEQAGGKPPRSVPAGNPLSSGERTEPTDKPR
ncbi:hypothetical protein [Ancylobacter lacus]|uniref:hypothetical protein n=1 Tax=Ancylobacter lacus TaxID=2579970 RepID=UPI001BD00B0E|nr:hypothetical protein [Ancylobacter lacus]MBS7538310.1 hypothetical protein [Ancylobacter lacus]